MKEIRKRKSNSDPWVGDTFAVYYKHQIMFLFRCECVCLEVAFGVYMYPPYINHHHECQISTFEKIDFPEDRETIINNFVAPLHHTNIHNLSTSHPSFAGAVVMLRYWLDNHLFSSHISTEAMELIVASVYLASFTHSSPPSTPVNGFLKALQLLAAPSWEDFPLSLHFSTDDDA